MNKPKMEVLIGVPGSGKSTYANKKILDETNWVKISRDDIRFSLGGIYDTRNETIVLKVQDAMIKASLAEGKNIVLDNTHCKVASVRDVINTYGKYCNMALKVIGGELSMETIKAQNKARDAAKHVPDIAIASMHKAFLNTIKQKTELDALIKEVAKDPEDIAAPAYQQDKSLPKALIFDIDGTIAKMNNKRGPFDWAKVGNDDPVEEILSLARKLSHSYKIIFMSGRDEACRTETENWLAKHYDAKVPIELYMRPAGDQRRDTQVKEELFMNNIAGKYYVEAAFDDRDVVVKMWRQRLGIKCLQVDYGNF